MQPSIIFLQVSLYTVNNPAFVSLLSGDRGSSAQEYSEEMPNNHYLENPEILERYLPWSEELPDRCRLKWTYKKCLKQWCSHCSRFTAILHYALFWGTYRSLSTSWMSSADWMSYSSRSWWIIFLFPSVICTQCTGFFCLAIIKGPPNDIYFIIEKPFKHYLQKNFHTHFKWLSLLV